MSEIVTPIGSFPASPASSDAPTVLLWVVTILVAVLGVVCLLLWQQIKESRTKCAEENALARKEASEARESAKREADNARDKVEHLYQQAIERFAERETRLITVVEANTQALGEIREIGSGYYRRLREQRDSGGPSLERRNQPHNPV